MVPGEPRSFVPWYEKKKKFLFLVTGPQTYPILIALERRTLSCEERARIQLCVSQELERRAMKRVRAGPRCGFDHGSPISTVDSAKRVRLGSELLKGVGIRVIVGTFQNELTLVPPSMT